MNISKTMCKHNKESFFVFTCVTVIVVITTTASIVFLSDFRIMQVLQTFGTNISDILPDSISTLTAGIIDGNQRTHWTDMNHSQKTTDMKTFKSGNDTKSNSSMRFDNTKTKTVLIWTPLRRGTGVPEQLGTTPFKVMKCQYQNCRMTTKRSEEATADALLFHMVFWNHSDLPSNRKTHQVYIFNMMESALHTKNLSGVPSGFFNATQTYRRDSDINTYYGKLIPLKNSEHRPKAVSRLAQRTKAVAWFVGNCHPRSHREEYATELGKYYPVHKFGGCSKKRASESQRSKYKYYFAAENSLCQDYITEKLYLTFRASVVPIVFGYSKYEEILPHKTVIDVRNFTSPKYLAEYLRRLDGNASLYMEYLEWKKSYKPIDHAQGYSFYCGLCAHMNTAAHSTKIYEDITDWWKKDKCINYTQYFKDVMRFES